MARKQWISIVVAVATFVMSMGQAAAQTNGGVVGISGSSVTVTNVSAPPVQVTPAHPRVTTHAAPRPSRQQQCAAAFNQLRSGMSASLRCLTTDEWARLEQLCGPHGLSVDRLFDRYTREHCPSIDLNVLARVRGEPVQPECLANTHPVRDRSNRIVDCECDEEGGIAVRLWSRRNGRPRVGCFATQSRANIATRDQANDNLESLRAELREARDALHALCRPSEDQTLIAACGALRTQLDGAERASTSVGATTDLTGVNDAITAINNRLDTVIVPQIHDLTCRMLRAEGREMPADCTDIPALPPRPATPSAASDAVHRFDFSFANALAVFRFGGGPLSVGAGGSIAWRYRFPGSHNLSFYVRGEAAYGDMGSNIGAVGLFGGGMGLAYQPSENVHLLLGLSVRSYGQPGDSTLRPASGAYRGLDAGVEATFRRYLTSSVFADLGVQMHYGEAVMIAPPAFTGGPNQDFHWTGTALTPRVGLGITF